MFPRPLCQRPTAALCALLSLLVALAACGSTAAPGSPGRSFSGTVPPLAATAVPAPAPAVEVDPPAGSTPAVPPDAFAATVVRVVDGDTLIAQVAGHGPKLRVRLIGIDTPETVKPGTPVACYGPQASMLTKALLAGGEVRAAYEPGARGDRYQRELWDLWLPDGRFVAGVLAASGAARSDPVRPQIRYAGSLAALASQASAAGRGLWGPPCNGRSFPIR